MGPHARPVPDPRADPPLGPARRGSSRTRWSGCWSRARWSAASSGRAARNASGATRTCCACSAGGRWRGCAARSSRSTRPRSAGSCRAGTAIAPVRPCRDPVPWLGGPRAARRGRRPAGGARPSRRPCWNATCCRPGSRATSRGCSTSSGSLGEVAWVGRGSLGRDDGRIALVRPGRDALRPVGLARRHGPAGRPAPRPRSASTSPTRGASLLPRPARAPAGGGPDREVLDALWDLVWAGEVTNDTFAPLRALRWKRTGGRRHPARAGPGRLTALGPPEAAGRWSLVEPPTGDADRAAPRPVAGAARAPRRADPRGRRGRGPRRRVQRASTRSSARSRTPAGSGAATSSTGSAPRSSPCRAPSIGCARRATPASARTDGDGLRPRRRRSGQPVRRRAALAASRRGRSAAAPARGGGVRRAGRRRRRPVPGARRLDAPDAGRPPTIPRSRWPRPRRCAQLVADGRLRSSSSARSTAMPWPSPRSASACSPPGSRPATAASSLRGAAPMPEGDTLYRTAAGLRPYLVGRRDRGPGAGSWTGPAGPSRRRPHASTRSSRQGKNLLIRFDGGLELRTHLRMNGSWHRYRPGERWRRPPSRARLVLEVARRGRRLLRCPGRRAVRDARRGAPPVRSAGSGRTCSRADFDAAEARRRLRDPARAGTGDRRRAARPARARRHRQRLQERDPVDRAGVAVRPVADARRRDARPPHRDGPPAARRQRRPRRAARSASRRPATAARPARSTSTAGAAGRAAAAGRRSARCGRGSTCRGRRTGARRARAVLVSSAGHV